MNAQDRGFPALIRDIRRQIALSQEDLARQLNVSYATVNRWENAQAKPSRLAMSQVKAFCSLMMQRGRLTLSTELLESAGLRLDKEKT